MKSLKDKDDDESRKRLDFLQKKVAKDREAFDEMLRSGEFQKAQSLGMGAKTAASAIAPDLVSRVSMLRTLGLVGGAIAAPALLGVGAAAAGGTMSDRVAPFSGAVSVAQARNEALRQQTLLGIGTRLGGDLGRFTEASGRLQNAALEAAAAALVPFLKLVTPIMEDLATFIKRVMIWIEQMSDTTTRIGGYLDRVPWDMVYEILKWVPGIIAIIEQLGQLLRIARRVLPKIDNALPDGDGGLMAELLGAMDRVTNFRGPDGRTHATGEMALQASMSSALSRFMSQPTFR